MEGQCEWKGQKWFRWKIIHRNVFFFKDIVCELMFFFMDCPKMYQCFEEIILYHSLLFCAISDGNFLLFVHGFVFWLSGFFQSYLIILLYIKPFFLKMSRKENSCCSWKDFSFLKQWKAKKMYGLLCKWFALIK